MYGDHSKIAQTEINFFESEQLFLMAFVHAYSFMKSLPPVNIQRELFRCTGLQLIVGSMNQRERQVPELFSVSGGRLNFSLDSDMLKSVKNYQQIFMERADCLNQKKAFGRGYATESNQFVNFMEKFPQIQKIYFSEKLKDILVYAYKSYRNKKTIPDSNIIFFLQDFIPVW